ncbi:MAG TPA: amidophosphoribosyltransferase, partial [Gallionella sp.]|nr:amidophosphoribosyltransferase [Gallionella sp.]
NVYGIDMPSPQELIATGRSDDEICREIGADRIIYQDLADLKAAVHKANPNISSFDASCFDGIYITGDISADYLNRVEALRGGGEANPPVDDDQLELNLAVSATSM